MGYFWKIDIYCNQLEAVVPENKKVFVRDATGLTKSVSIFDAISLNVSDMSVGAALASIGITMVALPSVSGVNLVYASLLAFVFVIPQIVIYSIMSTRISKTGGDYIWITRSLNAPFGAALSFAGFTANDLAYLALISLLSVFAIGSVGVFLGNTNMLGLALPGNIKGSTPGLQFVVAAIVFGAIVAINILRPKVAFRLVSALMVIGVITTVVAIFTLLSAGRSGVVGYMDYLNSTLGAPATYDSVASSYSGTTFDFSATLSIIPFFAIFVYPFMNAAPAVGSELRNKNSLRWAIPISVLIVMLLVTAAFATMYYVGGFAFINGALSNPTLVYSYSFNFWTLAMGVTSNVALQLLIGIGWILWMIAILGFGIIFFARYLFAQAFDRFLPSSFAYVSPKYSSPVVAHLIDLVITVGLIAATSFFYGTFSALFGIIVASMIYFAFIGITAIIYGLKKEKGSTKGTLIVAGILSAGVFSYITYQFLAAPTIWGGTNLAYGYIIATFIFGLVAYYVSKAYYSSKGVNITLAFKEIPPD